VLAAIVLVAVSGLVKVREILRLRRISRLEFRVAMVALVAVLLLGILKGILLAATASILFLLHKSARPLVAFLGRIPGTRRWSDAARNPDNELVDGVLIFRVESSLLYYNVEHIVATVVERLRAAGPGLKLVVCDLSASPYVDLAGARALEKLHAEVASRGAVFRVVEARASVRDLLRAEGLEEKTGSIDRFRGVEDVVELFEKEGAVS
jgi:SulP family sulfate permease